MVSFSTVCNYNGIVNNNQHYVEKKGWNMNFLYRLIVRNPKKILFLFGIASVISIVLFLCTGINYNMLDYLPEEANSTIALDKMNEEFEQPIPNLNVMVEDVSLTEALEIKENIAAAEYVKEVLWLDDAVDIKQPLEIQDSESVEMYYKDGNALFMVTVEDGKTQKGIENVRQAVGDSCKVSGTAADEADAMNSATKEAIRSIAMLEPIIIILLFLVTESWIEPIFYMLTMAAAILINLGTSFFLGEISFVTLAAAPILQLAVSLDYVVFLSHKFDEHKEMGTDPKEAIRLAMLSSGKSISASMLTTLFGFVALIFMKFKIGEDMGINLVKGVLLSFLCAMVFLPALLLKGTRLIDRTKHRRLFPTFSNLGNGILKIHILAALILVICIIPAYLGQKQNDFFYGTSEKTEVGTEAYEVEEKFGITNTMVLLIPKDDNVKEEAMCQELSELNHVTNVLSYAAVVSNKIPSEFLDETIVSQFYSEHYARIILTADCAYEGTDAFALVEEVKEIAQSYYPDEAYICGQSPNLYDMKECVEEDNRTVNMITVICIYLVLLGMTRNWFMPILLILAIKCSIWVNMSVPYFTASKLSYLCYLIVSTVQMGATVDYAILLTDTYQVNRQTADKKEAMRHTLGNVFSSILVSALTLAIAGFCMAAASSNAILSGMGMLIGRGAILSVVMVMLLLPTLLLLTDRIIPYTKLPFGRKKNPMGGAKS